MADILLPGTGTISLKVFNFANNALMVSEKANGRAAYSIPIDLSGLPSGVYAAVLETPYGTALGKVVLK